MTQPQRAQMITQACYLGMQVSEHQDIQTGKLVRQRTFDIRVIKSEYRRLKAESEGFVVNIGAIFRNTGSDGGGISGSAVESVAASLGRPN